MIVDFTTQAVDAIDDIARFVESKNTPGSGDRYALKFIAAIEQMAQPGVHYALCSHIEFSRLNYSCRNYNDWVIAFKIHGDTFTVYEIVHASVLKA